MSAQNGSNCQRCGEATGKVFGYPQLCSNCIAEYKLKKSQKKPRLTKNNQKDNGTGFFGADYDKDNNITQSNKNIKKGKINLAKERKV